MDTTKPRDNFLANQSYINGQDYNNYDVVDQDMEHSKDINSIRDADSLAEADANYPLDKWNQKQKELWKALVANGLVERNDVETFKLFASYFDLYYKIHRKVPKYTTIVLAMQGY